MTKVVLLTAQPRNPATGAATAVRLAGGGNVKPYYYGGQHFRAGVTRLLRMGAAIEWGENGWTGGVVPSTGVIGWAPSSKADLAATAAYYWPGAAIVVEEGEEETAVFATRLTGKVSDAPVQDGQLVITLADLSVGLDRPVVTARFAGTGGAEGGAEASGRIKRRSWGRVFNIEGRVLDKANNVYEFGDPAFPLQSFDLLRDKGRDAAPAPAVLAWQGSIAATLAALAASAPAQGSGVVAPSISCAKWWTQPAGPLTADLRGEVGAGYVETAPEIAARILAAVGGPAISNTAAAAALRPGPAGIHFEEDETINSGLVRLLQGVSLLWVLDAAAGTIGLREITFTGPVATLLSDTVKRVRTLRPVKSRRVGYKRSYRRHGDGEIASSLLASDVAGLGDLAMKDAVNLATNEVLNKSLANVDPTASTKLGTIAAYATLADNILVNPLLLLGTETWTLGSGATRTAGGAGDPLAFHLQSAAAGASAQSAIAAAPSGTQFYASMMAKAPTAGSSQFQIAVHWYTPTAYSGYSDILNFFPATTNWTSVEGKCNKPAGATRFVLLATGVEPNSKFGGFRLAPTQAGATLGSEAGVDFRIDGVVQPKRRVDNHLLQLTGNSGLLYLFDGTGNIDQLPLSDAGIAAMAYKAAAAWAADVSGRPAELIDGRIPAALTSAGRGSSTFKANDGRTFGKITHQLYARDGETVSFGATQPDVPKVVCLPGGNAAPAGQSIKIQAEGLTVSGFTMCAKSQAVAAGSTIVDSPSSAGGGGEPTRVINRSNAGAPFDGVFRYSVTVVVGNLGVGEPGHIQLDLYAKIGGTWTVVGNASFNSSDTYVLPVSPGTVDFGGGSEFGVSAASAEGAGTALSSFNSVSYTLGTVTETSLTPAGASAIPVLVMLQ